MSNQFSMNNNILKNGVQMLEESAIKRNTFTESEFLRFVPLYRHDGAETMRGGIDITQPNVIDPFDQLQKEFQARISLFHPVTIVSNDRKHVILRLPAVFTPMQTVESDTINRVVTASKSNNPYSTATDEAMIALIKEWENASAKDIKADIVASDKLHEEFLRRQNEEYFRQQVVDKAVDTTEADDDEIEPPVEVNRDELAEGTSDGFVWD